jgi:diguanylate cyclase (GGDEF)-like protein
MSLLDALPPPEQISGYDAVVYDQDRYLQGMERLLTAVQELSLARQLSDVQRIVRTVARELTGCDGATFVLNDSNTFCYYADEDAIAPLWKGKRFPQEICISGWVMRNRKSTVIPDIYQDPRIPEAAYRPTFVKSLAMVPIRTMDPVGAIGNYWARVHQPSAVELRLLQALADSTSIAMENVAVYAELEKRVVERTAELTRANQAIQQISVTDTLTGLHNRRGFYQLAGAALDAGRRIVLAFIDVDGLKKVNDGLGHAVGDSMLADIAATLKASFRHDDVMARLGGDEFCVLALDPPGDGAALRAAFLHRLDEFNSLGNRPYQLSASIGLVETMSGDARSLDQLLLQADELMYKEKQQKRRG